MYFILDNIFLDNIFYIYVSAPVWKIHQLICSQNDNVFDLTSIATHNQLIMN